MKKRKKHKVYVTYSEKCIRVIYVFISLGLVGCASLPPKIEVKPIVSVFPDAYVIKAEYGRIECFHPESQRVMVFPFKGDVMIFKNWITFQPLVEGNIRKIVLRLLCQVFVTAEPLVFEKQNEKKQKDIEL